MSQMGRTEGDAASYFMNFNQDCSSLSVGSKTGFNLYSLATIDTNVEEIYGSHGEDICLVERLFSSSLVALVSLNAPRKLKVCHYKKGTEICNYSYSNTILAVRLNRARLVVCLEESLYIHNIRDMKVVHTIRDTPPNCSGLCALAADSDHCYLAYPGSARTGEVQIFDAVNLHAKTMIPAHESPLAAIAFNPSGSEIATASEKGTVIRVFNVHDGSKLFEFRRGMKRCVSIASMSFSTCSKYLCCSSNTETVHIFKLDVAAGDSAGSAAEAPGLGALGSIGGATVERTERAAAAAPVKDDWMGYLTKTVSSYLPLALPAQVTDVFTQGRAFALAVLPVIGTRHTCVITTINRSLKLLVASQEGYLYVYQVPSVEGGECRLIIRHDLRTTPELSNGSSGSGADAQSMASLESAEPTAPVPIPQSSPASDAGTAATISPDAFSVKSSSVSPPASVATTTNTSRGGGSISDAEDEYLGL